MPQYGALGATVTTLITYFYVKFLVKLLHKRIKTFRKFNFGFVEFIQSSFSAARSARRMIEIKQNFSCRSHCLDGGKVFKPIKKCSSITAKNF